MLPTADTLRLIWHMLAAAGTLVLTFLFAYEVVKGRSLAKARELERQKRAELVIPDLPEAEDPWAPKGKKSADRVPSWDTPSLSLRPNQRPMWRSTES